MRRKNKITVEEFKTEMNNLVTVEKFVVEKTKQEVLKKVGRSLVSDQAAKAFQYSGDLYNESIRLKLALNEVDDAYLRVKVDKKDFDSKQELQNVRDKTIWELEELLKKVVNMKRAMTMLDNVCH